MHINDREYSARSNNVLIALLKLSPKIDFPAVCVYSKRDVSSVGFASGNSLASSDDFGIWSLDLAQTFLAVCQPSIHTSNEKQVSQ